MTEHRITIDAVDYTVLELTRSDVGLRSLGPSDPGQALPLTAFVRWWLHHTVYVMPDYDRDGYLYGDVDDVIRYAHAIENARPDLGGIWPYTVGIYRGANEREAIVTHGRGFGRSGAHTAGQNHTSYAAAICGDTRVEPVTSGMLAAVRMLIARETPWCTEDVLGHQHAPPYYSNGVNLNATACPGPMGLGSLGYLRAPFTYTTTPPAPPPVVLPPPAPPIPVAALNNGDPMFIAQHPRTSTPYLVYGTGLMVEVTGAADELKLAGIKNAGKLPAPVWNRLCAVDAVYRDAVKFPGTGGPSRA